MKTNESNTNQLDKNELIHDLEGYPIYPENEDIYNKFRREKSIDPENVIKFIENEKVGIISDRGFEDDISDDDLDDSSDNMLDDNVEIVVNEDEENEYFSLGKENQLDLIEISGI